MIKTLKKSAEAYEAFRIHKNAPVQRAGSNVAPVAIVGIAFRFPGDQSDEYNFWNALKEKQDLITQVPSDRWATRELQHDKRSEAGRSITFSAGVLSRIDEFDASFFGISSREAAWLDPQQRLLLELSWEAMENAGVLPSSMAGSDCAVYVGISSLDYGTRGLDDLASLSSHTMTGNTLSMAANRLSYVFDLHGPSLAVDTACSSSLVALHHACESLRTGEASTAMVGGVNLLLHPYPFVGFTKASMLSADGRCKSFDASANGYVRSEGGAVVLLKLLDRAIADGDDIQAVILSNGVNADGGRKTGITIPSCDGQVELMQRVLTRSGLSAQDIDYVEAHATGTTIGDPIEAAALGAVYGKGRARALPIGSVKANLGHMESASGMAGLVKAVLILKNRGLPPTLHGQTLNPHIDFSALNLELITAYRDLVKDTDKPLVVGVNSFGFGGANAHILLQEFLPRVSHTTVDHEIQLPPLFLSARCDAALRTMAERYASMLSDKSPRDFYDIAHAAAYHREHLKKRLAFIAGSPEEAVRLLSSYAQGESPAEIFMEDILPKQGSVAFVYSGNGAQWVGMGRKLLAESPQFSEIVTRLDAMINPLTGFSVIDELNADGPASRLDDTVVAQPLLFAIQVACTLLLKEMGIEPTAVTGHSVGEIAAAWAAGALDLDQAIRVIVARSAAQGKTRGTGRMAAVGLSETGMQTALAELGGDLDVTIAGSNSPTNVTLSGSLGALECIRSHLEPRGVFFRLLDLDYAFHSRQMDPVKECFLESLTGLAPSPTNETVFVSTVSGDMLNGSALDTQYWWRNVREPVRFADAVAKLAELGCRTFIEIGPHAILQRYISECFTAADILGRVLSILHRDADGHDRIVETALRTHLLAEQPALNIFFPSPGRRVRLPNYPWQRERHWHPSTIESRESITRDRVHPLLGWRLHDAEMAWENTIDPTILPWLPDHKIGGAIVFPGSAYAEMALAAARERQCNERLVVEGLDIVSPMVFVGEHARTVRFILHPRDGGFQILSRQRLSTDEWTLHAAGRVLEATDHLAVPCLGPVPEPKKKIERETHYNLTAALGLDYGPTFQGFIEAYVGVDRLEAVLQQPGNLKFDDDYLIHPAILDVCYQSLVDFFQADIESGQGVTFLPVKVGHLNLYRHVEVNRFHARLRRRGARSVLADFELLDSSGGLIASLTGCRFRIAPLLHQEQSKVSSWDIIPWLCPHPAESLSTELPRTEALIEISRKGLAGMEVERRTWFEESLPLSKALTLSFAYEAFRLLAQKEQDGLLRLVEATSPYARWLTGLLLQEGLLYEQDDRLVLAADSDLPAAEEIWHTLLRENPSCLPQLILIGRVGIQLPQVLTNEALGREFLWTLQHSPAAQRLFDEDPAYLGMRLALESTLHHLAISWPEHRRLRVLEITAAPSELPRRILDSLPEDRLDYVLAFADEKYYQRQQVAYQEFANVTLASFNSADWKLVADKPLPEAFDIVVLRHVLHKADSPYAALEQARCWLAFGGVLLLAERHPDWSADFLAGMDPAWWHETNTREAGSKSVPISSLVAPEAWGQALRDKGFDEIESFTEPAADGLAEGAYLLIAKRPLRDTNTLPDPEAGGWLLLADKASSSLVDSLRIRLENLGQRVVVTERIHEGDLVDVRHVVHFLGWNCAPEDATSLLANLLRDVQMLAAPTAQPPRLWLVTHGGALASGLPMTWMPKPVQSALWGFGRVVMNEYPALGCTLIDISGDPDVPEMPLRLENELLYPDGGNEIVLSAKTRHTLVMREEKTTSSKICDSDARFRLDFRVPGKLRNLIWLPEKERPLHDDEIEVRVKATGLNFRDVMYLMGLLPDEAVENGFSGASLGLEFSGIVTRIGPGVRDYQPGDAVMGFGSSCFASHVVTLVDTVMPMPENWSFEAAATVPTVYFSVYYALRHLADLQPGERVLIHGAAGGVGIAAIRLAQHLGAEIFATAGSDEKRDFVRLLGVNNVYDSRSLEFADNILATTSGEGVDVVLNCLAGEAIRRNLHILKPFGRFLELGKRDFFENTPIGLGFFKNNISYFGIDADQLFSGRPQLAARLFREIMALFREGVLAPLPFRVFKAERIVDAFYEMRESRHIGKVVVSLADARPRMQNSAPPVQAVRFDKTSTWLVTGGLEGFGLESARWLATRGVGNLVLLGRRGMKTPGARDAIAELVAQGVNVIAISCDVTDAKALAKALNRVQKTMPPLKGVLHAAMVLDDQLIPNLGEQSIEAVLHPKLLGAWNLHTLTMGIPLEHFVLYSSITTAMGNPGQANYVAANAALEGLAQMRRHIGLPAVCIGWGPIGNAGYLSRNTGARDSLGQRLGKPPLSALEALNQLDKILAKNSASLAVANFDWNVLSRLLPSATCRRFAILNRSLGDVDLAGEATDLRALITSKTAEEITVIIRNLVIQEVAQVLLIKADRIDAKSSLHDLGLDSLMAVELAKGLEHRFGLQLPIMMFNESPTAERVTSFIVERLVENTQNDVDTPIEGLVQDLARQHGEEMTQSDIKHLIDNTLEFATIDGSQAT